jgi:bla regulator protein blaR1
MITDYFSARWVGMAPAMANHLWQSTLFAVVAATLTFALRKNFARVRYRLWLAASVKFLIPFSLLIGLGGHWARSRGPVSVQNGLYSAVEEVSQPFSQSAAPVVAPSTGSKMIAYLFSSLPEICIALWLCGFVAALGLWWLRWRRISSVLHGAASMSQGREVDALRQLERMAGLRKPTTLLLSQASLEPGVFGIVRPVLLWPMGISAHLEDAHLKAILAHEIWHVRRRDNLTAAVHMVVEAVFWFHPLVWWLGARLVEEREQACDEEVLQMVHRPQIYAESILKTCEFCVASPLACISGVTGADLKRRILRIMTERVASRLDFNRKLLLIAAGLIAVTAPILFGLLNAAPIRAELQTVNTTTRLPAFEVASIKPNKSGEPDVRLMFTPDGFSATNVPLREFIRMAYQVQEFQMSGGPPWINSERYDIEAKVDSSAAEQLRQLDQDQHRRMLQPLLEDRFQLKVHWEQKELPVYALAVAKNGPKLHEAKAGDTYPDGFKGPDGVGHAGLMRIGPGGITAQGVPMDAIVRLLSQQLGRTVVDKTGLKGNYDVQLQWTPDNGPASMMGPDSKPAPDSGPSIFTAIQEQLGLKLESQKGPVDVLMIDSVGRPSAN